MDDKSIVKLFLERDENAIAEAERKYKRYCGSIAYGILGDESDCEECVNDALLGLWNTIPPNNPENLKTYLAKLVRNLALNRYKMLSAYKRGGGNVEASLDELAGCIASRDITEDVIDSLWLSQALNEFLATMSADARTIFVQRYWFFRTVSEIANDLSVGESRVKASLMRTRNKLSKFLKGKGYTHEA
ncbi:MAG: sigma-70 family RNA polymerase sigma factor [Clostridia bacterium]|nr:sigma-70 family RNA polymerase sigma factor [Clostridia bacterium]